MALNSVPNRSLVVTAAERTRLFRLAYRLCWNTHDAEDVLQNALLAATRHRGRLRDDNRRWPWLCRIVVQQGRLHWRRQRTQVDAGAVELAQHDPARSPDDREDIGMLMRRLIVHLPEKQRIAVTLRHIEQLEYPRIAEIMRVAESTSRAHVRAGLESMRRMIVTRHPEWHS